MWVQKLHIYWPGKYQLICELVRFNGFRVKFVHLDYWRLKKKPQSINKKYTKSKLISNKPTNCMVASLGTTRVLQGTHSLLVEAGWCKRCDRPTNDREVILAGFKKGNDTYSASTRLLSSLSFSSFKLSNLVCSSIDSCSWSCLSYKQQSATQTYQTRVSQTDRWRNGHKYDKWSLFQAQQDFASHLWRT